MLVPFKQPDLAHTKYSPRNSTSKRQQESPLMSTFMGFSLNANHEIENWYPRLNTIGKYADTVEHTKVKV